MSKNDRHQLKDVGKNDSRPGPGPFRCRRGHNIAGHNKMVTKAGYVRCRQCQNDGYNRRYREKRAGMSKTSVPKLMMAIRKLKNALQFYANGSHFEQSDDELCPNYAEAETVSGEPHNFVCGHGDYTAEDGAIARVALEEIGKESGE